MSRNSAPLVAVATLTLSSLSIAAPAASSAADRVMWAGALSGSGEPMGTAFAAPSPATVRVSVSSSGLQGNHQSSRPAVSADGRFVVFESGASNLVAGDTNGRRDVFVRDLEQGVTQRVSVSSGGRQGNHNSGAPVVSADGRFVVFTSFASNLVAGDTDRRRDVFVRDLEQGVTQRVSVSSGGQQGNNDSAEPSVSADGRFVVFTSFASNLTAGDTDHIGDVFVRDRKQEVTRLVSVSSRARQSVNGSTSGVVSANGRFVAFRSFARTLVAGDTNKQADVFVRDLKKGVTRRVSVSSSEHQANFRSSRPAISADGRFVVFDSNASNLVQGDTNTTADVFVRDRKKGVTRLVSVNSSEREANLGGEQPAVSASGRFVAFVSGASNLVAVNTNKLAEVFVRDRKQGVTRLVSVNSSGRPANSRSSRPAISANGGLVAFISHASNLVTGDTNNTADAFLRVLL